MSNRDNNNSEEAILKAAEKEFVERGFDGARTTSIAERAGVTHAMLHYFFRTKEQLFERILEEKLVVLADSMLLIFGEEGLPLKERLEKGISAHFDFIAKNPDLPRFLLGELPRVMPLIQKRLFPQILALMPSLQKELKGDVDMRMLILDILSQNLFPFVAMPVVEMLSAGEERDAMLERIKQENIKIILRRIENR
jgi:AcrR family transcriptional regulator